MNKKEPIEMGLNRIKELIEARQNKYRFVTDEFGIVDSFRSLMPDFDLVSDFLTKEQPFRVKEIRILIIKQGTARTRINLIEQSFKPNRLFLITPGSIIQLLETSPDFDMKMIGVNADFLPLTRKESFFVSFFRPQQNFAVDLSPQELMQTKAYFTLIWNIAQERPFREAAIKHLLQSLLYSMEYIINHAQAITSHIQTRQESVFQRFISLVNAYSKHERNVEFYANKLCLTPRYLNTVIRQTSQQTVMDWINQSIIQEAKIMLKHSDMLVCQISDELHFANPSFFCKFFKRITGITPQTYRNGLIETRLF